MTTKQNPQELSDEALENVHAAGLMDTPVGGWGAKAAASDAPADAQLSLNDPKRRDFNSTAGGSPNV